jgi:hypothetical protein
VGYVVAEQVSKAMHDLGLCAVWFSRNRTVILGEASSSIAHLMKWWVFSKPMDIIRSDRLSKKIFVLKLFRKRK